MKRIVTMAVVVGVAVGLVPAHAATTARLRGAPASTRATAGPGFWRAYQPRNGQVRLSGPVELALKGLDFQRDDAGFADAFPAAGLPRLPRGFAPDLMVNQDRLALPHNETSVAVDPRDPRHVVGGANDYRLGFGSSGFYTSFDFGQSWYDGVLPFPTVYLQPPALPSPAPALPRTLLALDGGGDPAVAIDHDGTTYYAEINFHRDGCASGVFIFRSLNGGQTWSRPILGNPNPGDTRTPGDGVVVANANDNDCGHFYDKEYIAVGPRPAGVSADAAADTKHLSSDRLYATWSDFLQEPRPAVVPYLNPVLAVDSPTYESHSDDQGRHWSTPMYIGGVSSDLCSITNASQANTGPIGIPPDPFQPNSCLDSQGSVPTVDKHGTVSVTFANSDGGTACALQILVVSSSDGGATWSPPSRVACQVGTLPKAGSNDINGKPICPTQAAGEPVLSGFCFRVPLDTQESIATDPRDGSLHVTFVDNPRGGTDWLDQAGAKLTALDVFTSASHDGGRTWGKPVLVNAPVSDHLFPWSAFGPDGTFYVGYLDRALSPGHQGLGSSMAISHDGGATFVSHAVSTGTFDPKLGFRDGLFLGDYDGLAAGPLGAVTLWPDTRRAATPASGDNPTQVWSDVVGARSSDFGLGGPVVAAAVIEAPAAPSPPAAAPAPPVVAARTAQRLPATGPSVPLLPILVTLVAAVALGRARWRHTSRHRREAHT